MEWVKIDHTQTKPNFESWWKTIESSIWATAASELQRLGLHELAAADITQDVALAAYFTWCKVRELPGEDLARESQVNFFPNARRSAAWARTRARWICLDRFKVKPRELLLGDVAGADIITHVTPAKTAIRAELMDLINQLPAEQRDVLHLALEGYTSDEIAEKLDKKSNSVRSLLRHARHRMLKLLTQDDEDQKH